MTKKKITKPQLEPSEEIKDFLKVGGSPVPGITLRRILRGHKQTTYRFDWSPDGEYLATPSEDMTIRIWNVERGEHLATLKGHTGTVYCVAWSPDGQKLVTGSSDKTLRLWDAEKKVETIVADKVHENTIFGVVWSPDGNKIASCSVDGTIIIWNAETLEPLITWVGHGSQANSISWSPDGKKLASCSHDGTVRLWQADSGLLLATLTGHSNGTYSTVWIPEQPLIASAGGDATVRLWNTENGSPVQTLEGHTDVVKLLSLSSDGKLLASKSNDHTIRLWHTDRWETIAVLDETTEAYWTSGMAFSPHRLRLATQGGSSQGVDIRIWDLDTKLLLSNNAAAESVRYTTAKLVLVGDSGVGKTGLGWRLAHDEFKEHASTHGQQFWVVSKLSTKRKDGTECEAVLWDLAGQHIYRSIHTIFLDDVDLSLVVFDPSNRHDPLKGAEFWLEQLSGKQALPPTVLVGARVDRGAPVTSQQEFEQFCQRYGISGGYISTSAMTGTGLDELLEIIRNQIPWEQMTATVTTATFKRIKEYVLSLKEKPDRRNVLVRPAELRRQLESTDPEWQFTDAEMMTAVKHLENHGYVFILRSSSGEEFILLTPELLVSLAASIVLQADKHPRELGALSETELLRGGYPFQELIDLEQAERQILLDVAVMRFLSHNICFRETLGAEALLIFPGLIKLKRPLLDEVESLEDMSYIVRGRVENVYPALVVLLGYTQTFTRVNQWQSQAQYEMGKGEICGFRLIEEREGETELVLYYSAALPDFGRQMFQGLFESFLYQRDVEVTRFPPVVCPLGHRQERTTVIKRVRTGKKFLHCEECGTEISLPEIEKPSALGTKDERLIRREEALARLRSEYETHLVRVKGFRRDRAAPRCYISSMPEQASWASSLAQDLRDAGVLILEDQGQAQESDFVILVGSPAYTQAWEAEAESIAADKNLIRSRLHQAEGQWPTFIPLVLKGRMDAACPRELRGRSTGDFRDETHYAVGLFDLVLTLYAIPLNNQAFEPLREALKKQWEETLGGVKGVFISYAWGGESEVIANQLDLAFQDRGVIMVRDKPDLGFKGSIKTFMESIGRGQCVILVISDKYLKSANCLFELLQTAKQGDFTERIFPIVLEDARIYSPLDRISYVQYWEKQLAELDAAMDTVSPANMQGFREDIDLYTEIRALLPRLADILKDMNTLTPEIHRGSNFEQLYEAVMAKLAD
jgi:small GTP-binding protein